MQFQVPQFIETEDKIVGPFTLHQFIYIAAAGGFSFVLYFAVQQWLWFIISFFLFALAGSFAFIKIGGRSFEHVLLAAFNFYWNPQSYVWQPEHLEAASGLKQPGPMGTTGTFLEDIVSGKSLRDLWRGLQTGAKTSKVSGQQFLGKIEDRFQVLQRLSGEREAARRIDYR